MFKITGWRVVIFLGPIKCVRLLSGYWHGAPPGAVWQPCDINYDNNYYALCFFFRARNDHVVPGFLVARLGVIHIERLELGVFM